MKKKLKNLNRSIDRSWEIEFRQEDKMIRSKSSHHQILLAIFSRSLPAINLWLFPSLQPHIKSFLIENLAVLLFFLLLIPTRHLNSFFPIILSSLLDFLSTNTFFLLYTFQKMLTNMPSLKQFPSIPFSCLPYILHLPENPRSISSPQSQIIQSDSSLTIPNDFLKNVHLYGDLFEKALNWVKRRCLIQSRKCQSEVPAKFDKQRLPILPCFDFLCWSWFLTKITQSKRCLVFVFMNTCRLQHPFLLSSGMLARTGEKLLHVKVSENLSRFRYKYKVFSIIGLCNIRVGFSNL